MKTLALVRWLFGPRLLSLGGDEPEQATSTTTSTTNYSPEELAARNKIWTEAGLIYDRQKPLWSSILNPAAKPVPASANTLLGQQMVRDAALGSGMTLSKNAAGALNFGLSGAALNPNTNPGFQGALDTAIRRVGTAYTDPGGVISKIKSNFGTNNSGGYSTREGIAGGIAGREYLNTIGDVTSKMTSDAYDKGLDYMKSSMAFAPNMYNLMMQPGVSVGAVGQQQEGYDQAQVNAKASDALWKLTAPWQALAPYSSIVQGFSNPSTSTTSTAPVAGSNPMAGLGTALSVASLFF